MIEIRRNQETHFYPRLFINGFPAEQVVIRKHVDTDKFTHHIWVHDIHTTNKLSNSFSEIAEDISVLHLKVRSNLLAQIGYVKVARLKNEQLFVVQFKFELYPDWKRPYSFAEYAREFIKTLEGIEGLVVIGKRHSNAFTIQFPVNSLKSSILKEITRFSIVLSKIDKDVENSLIQLRKDSIVMSFDFPEEVKIPCEQYLLYFAQFLKDLGVEANTALTHEAGQVLFTVTPDDKQQALDKIRTALEVYLHLPSSPVTDLQQSEIAILRLNSQLQQFQSQLSLARAEIQMKEAAIQLQKVTIGQLNGEVVIDSLKDVTPKPKDKEELLGDIVSLIPLKGKGFEVNLPELFRKLKQLFRDKGQEIKQERK